MKKLLVGPWVGEFGWEVAFWAPHARIIARDFHDITVVCEPGHEALYADFTDEFVPFVVPDIVQIRDCEFAHTTQQLGVKSPKLKLQQLCAADRWLNPYELRKTIVWEWGSLPYMPLGTFDTRLLGDGIERVQSNIVAIHARSPTVRHQCHEPVKSWPIEKWNELVAKLDGDGFFVVALGSMDGAMCPEGALDNRLQGQAKFDTKWQIRTMRTSRVVIGPSSGTMVLAAHCGVPCVWWSNRAQPAELVYAQEGEVAASCNPHKIQHHRAAEVWDPSVDQVLAAVQAALA